VFYRLRCDYDLEPTETEEWDPSLREKAAVQLDVFYIGAGLIELAINESFLASERSSLPVPANSG
jgi:hypothetical protein